MNLTFINRTTSKILPMSENIYFYCSYIIADTSSYHAVFSMMEDFSDLKIESNNEEFILELYLLFNKDNINCDVLRSEANILFSWCQKHKSVNHKTKEMIINYQRKNLLLRKMLNFIVDFYQNMTSSFGFAKDQLGLIDGKIASCMRNIYESEDYLDEHTEDSLITLIPEYLFRKENYFVIETLMEDILKPFYIQDPDQLINIIKENEFVCIPLFKIPYFRFLNSNSLLSIRNTLKSSMDTLSDIINDFTMKLKGLDFDNNAIGVINSYIPKVQVISTNIQEQIDNQVYIKKEMNSGSLFLNMHIYLGICKIKSIPEYYCEAEVIKPFVINSINKNIEIKSNLNKSQVFIYMKPEEKSIHEFLVSYKNSLTC